MTGSSLGAVPPPTDARRFVLGGAFGREPEADSFARLDRFDELGGAFVETAYSYAGGAGKAVVGSWIREHPGRLQVVSKVGHGMRGQDIPLPRDVVLAHTQETVDVLGGRALEVLMLHCDDPNRPVPELAATLRAVRDGGLARRVGVSNWSAQRLTDLAAEFEDDEDPLVVSYHFSLASPDVAALASAGLAADESILELARRRGWTLLSWSSQAHGYFARTDDRPSDPFDTAVSRARRERCVILARERAVPPATLALAWTLGDDFVWPSIGPRTLEQLESSVLAGQVELSPAERRWLLEGD